MSDDELALLNATLAAHRQMLLGAHEANPDLDLHRALEVHAGLGAILTRWSDYRASEQRMIVKTIEYLVNDEDDEPDLRSPNGFDDDLHQLHRLQEYLGYV